MSGCMKSGELVRAGHPPSAGRARRALAERVARHGVAAGPRPSTVRIYSAQ
jgi:hypothetical protein